METSGLMLKLKIAEFCLIFFLKTNFPLIKEFMYFCREEREWREWVDDKFIHVHFAQTSTETMVLCISEFWFGFLWFFFWGGGI